MVDDSSVIIIPVKKYERTVVVDDASGNSGVVTSQILVLGSLTPFYLRR